MNTPIFNIASYSARSEAPSIPVSKLIFEEAGCDYVHRCAVSTVLLPRGFTSLRSFHPLDPQDGLTAFSLGRRSPG